jgi:hypothetical protein
MTTNDQPDPDAVAADDELIEALRSDHLAAALNLSADDDVLLMMMIFWMNPDD